MNDVEDEMEELQRKLTSRTREIEALVAAEQNLGELNSMESTEYARLRIYVDELIYQWQEAKVHPSASNPDTAINRLIADRLEIEEQILALEIRTDRSSAGRSQEAWLRHLSRPLVMVLSAWLGAPLDHIGARTYIASVLRNNA